MQWHWRSETSEERIDAAAGRRTLVSRMNDWGHTDRAGRDSSSFASGGESMVFPNRVRTPVACLEVQGLDVQTSHHQIGPSAIDPRHPRQDERLCPDGAPDNTTEPMPMHSLWRLRGGVLGPLLPPRHRGERPPRFDPAHVGLRRIPTQRSRNQTGQAISGQLSAVR
ncbi:MAG: hypothetical protein JW751_12160 [Polyangiaceae bacterium]|nr:hypothetical protein [Polyangiaceae bacterium]